MRKQLTQGWALIIAYLVWASPSHAQLMTNLSLEHRGLTRTYDLIVPTDPGSASLALLIDLHPFDSTASAQRNFSRSWQLADAENVVVAWPNALGGSWNAPMDADDQDVSFIRALVAQISAEYDIDPARVYAHGFSQGGLMVGKLACEAADVFAAVSTVAGAVLVGSSGDCRPSRAIPIINFRGINDDTVPYEGGQVTVVDPPDNVLGAEETLEFWQDEMNCSDTSGRESLAAESFCDWHRNCSGDAEVGMCTVTGTGSISTHLIYQNTDGLNLVQLSWDFMSRFSHPDKASAFRVNQGLNDAWFNPLTNGQGFFIIVFPDIPLVFLAWFTYDTERPEEGVEAILGDPGQRWITAQGGYEGDTAELSVVITRGGVFNSGEPAPENEIDGSMTVTFESCSAGTVTYNIPSLGLTGVVPIQRIANDNVALCEALTGN